MRDITIDVIGQLLGITLVVILAGGGWYLGVTSTVDHFQQNPDRYCEQQEISTTSDVPEEE